MTPQPTLLVLVGIPGAGKTTWAETFSKLWGVPYESRDDIPFSANQRERWLWLLGAHLRRGQSVVADSTGCRKETRIRLLALAAQHEAAAVAVVFRNTATAFERNAAREQPIDHNIMRLLLAHFIECADGLPEEGFEEVWDA